MAEVVKQDDGTYDVVGMSKAQLDVLTTFVGSVFPNLPSSHDEEAYNLYRALRVDGEFRPEWVGK